MYFGLLPRSDSLNMRITYLQNPTNGRGHKASHFYDDNHLFYITSAGISLLNISTSESRLLYSNITEDFFQVPSLYYDDQLKRLWIGTGSAGLFYYDIIRKSLSDIPIRNFPKQPILAIRKDAKNTLLIGIDGQGIWNISEKGDTILHIYKEDLNNPFHSGVTEYMIFFATVQKLDSHIHRKAVFL